MSKYFILHDIVTYSHGLFEYARCVAAIAMCILHTYRARFLIFRSQLPLLSRILNKLLLFCCCCCCYIGSDSDIIFNRFWNLWHVFLYIRCCFAANGIGFRLHQYHLDFIASMNDDHSTQLWCILYRSIGNAIHQMHRYIWNMRFDRSFTRFA